MIFNVFHHRLQLQSLIFILLSGFRPSGRDNGVLGGEKHTRDLEKPGILLKLPGILDESGLGIPELSNALVPVHLLQSAYALNPLCFSRQVRIALIQVGRRLCMLMM